MKNIQSLVFAAGMLLGVAQAETFSAQDRGYYGIALNSAALQEGALVKLRTDDGCNLVGLIETSKMAGWGLSITRRECNGAIMKVEGFSELRSNVVSGQKIMFVIGH